jgi:hypothetical protein
VETIGHSEDIHNILSILKMSDLFGYFTHIKKNVQVKARE